MKKESYLALTWSGPARPSPLAWCQSSPTSASRQRRDIATPPSSPRLLLLAADRLQLAGDATPPGTPSVAVALHPYEETTSSQAQRLR